MGSFLVQHDCERVLGMSGTCVHSLILFSKGCDARVPGFLQFLPDFPEPVEPLVLGSGVSMALSPSFVVCLETSGTIGLATIPFAGLALGTKVVT